MKRVFLIDFENVHDSGFSGVEHLTESDMLHIFYTENAKHITLDSLDQTGTLRMMLHKVPASKQSLDMHLVSFLGFLLGKNPDKETAYIVISKDKDYDNVVSFWVKKGYADISRHANIAGALGKETPKKPAKPKKASARKAKDPAKDAALSGKETKAEEAKTTEEKKGFVPKQEALEESQDGKPEAIVLTEENAEGKNEAKQPETEEKKPTSRKSSRGRKKTEAKQQEKKDEERKPEAEEKTLASADEKNSEPKQPETEGKETEDRQPKEDEKKEEPKKAGKKAEPKAEKPVAGASGKSARKAEKPTGQDLNDVNNAVQKTLSDGGFPTEIISYSASTVCRSLSEQNPKQLVYRAFLSKFGQKKGREVYSLVKKFL